MPLQNITENIVLLNRPPDSHMYDCNYFLVRGEKPVLIDCGCGKAHDMLQKNLSKAGCAAGDISCLIGTHCHYDHVGGLEKLREENPDLILIV